eukprot:6462297-Amphidinium_carterae.1
MRGLRVDDHLKGYHADLQGYLRAASVPKADPVNLGTEVRMVHALNRRGYAMEMADLMSFSSHQLIVQTYLDTLVMDPPPGYASVNWAQIRRADEELVRLLADKSAGNLRRVADGSPRLDELVPELLKDPRWTIFVTPLPSSGAGRGSKKRQVAPPAPPAKMAKSGGKCKNKTDRNSPMPTALRGLMSHTSDGRRI